MFCELITLTFFCIYPIYWLQVIHNYICCKIFLIHILEKSPLQCNFLLLCCYFLIFEKQNKKHLAASDIKPRLRWHTHRLQTVTKCNKIVKYFLNQARSNVWLALSIFFFSSISLSGNNTVFTRYYFFHLIFKDTFYFCIHSLCVTLT